MKKLLILFALIIPLAAFMQPAGLYNGTEEMTGVELKLKLHDLIKNHRCLGYYYSKYVLAESDADPIQPGNVILVYTGRSQDAMDYGTGSNQLQREHVWAKSHGSFNEVLPMFSDVHNLKPEDASVNSSRSNLDFDNGGFAHPEATQCRYDDDSWEPRDQVKGDIARIIFYMDARYEGGTGEIDLKVKDQVNNYPNPWHGKLSTLLEWNTQDPPDDFERHRNDVISRYQGNRNPFIDHPEFVDLIWNNGQLPSIRIGDISMAPTCPTENQTVVITCKVANLPQNGIVKLLWGNYYDYLENDIEMVRNGDWFTAIIPAQPAESNIYFSAFANDGSGNFNSSIVYNYRVQGTFAGVITPIQDIQGPGENSPLTGQVVSTSGTVTGTLLNGYFLQDKFGPRHGIYIYDPERKPAIGDSLVITGEVSEYYGMTEISNLTGYYLIRSGAEVPFPYVISTSQAGEDFEAVLVRIENATCTYSQHWTNYGMWKVDDGTGTINVHNNDVFEFDPYLNQTYTVTGPLNYTYSEWKIELRFLQDVMEPTAIGNDQVFQEILIYPNPATDEILVNIPLQFIEKSGLKIFDMTGKEHLSMGIEPGVMDIRINLKAYGFVPGVYLVVISDQKHFVTGELIIKH